MQIRQEETLLNSNRRYSLRKLSVGLASVLIGISFLNGTKTTVKADTIANNNDEYAEAHEHNESSESIQDALLKNTDVAEGDSVHMQSAKNVDTAGILTNTSSVQSSSAAQNSSEITKSFGLGANKNSNISTKAGEVSKAGNFEVAGDISSAQNSVAKPQQNNLLDDLDKQKTFTENNQAETKNQENRLADQTNSKLTNNGGTDSKKDLEQNLTTPDETKSTLTTKSDAEKSIAGSSSVQQVNNQSNNRAEDNAQTQPQISKKLTKKVLAVNLIETNSLPTTNGGFDEATWGKLDVNDWQGSVQNGIYQLTSYTGDPLHIIVPNAADFEQAGKSTNGLQVGITSDTARSIFSFSKSARTIAFSKTSNQKVKAIGTDWSYVFSVDNAHLSKFDGSNLDVSNITDMSGMFNGMSFNFFNDKVSDLTSLANWDTSKVTNMREMFDDNSISDLTPLANWDVSNVTDMMGMFENNSISNLTGLAKWDTSKVTNMSYMFDHNSISDLTPLDNWNTNKVTNMNSMFDDNKVSDLTPLANWDTSNVTNMSLMFTSNKVSDLTPLANWDTNNVTNMARMFENNSISNLTPLSHWNVNNVTNMSRMFISNQISDLTSLVNWDTSKVTNMSEMFAGNQISNLARLANWDTSKVTNMNSMFADNQISNLTPLVNWDVSNVTNMSRMFTNNHISDLTSLAHWNTSKVTDMSTMFANNPDLIDLKPIANWNINSVSPWGFSGLFSRDTKLDLTNINNTPLMQNFLKKPDELQGATFITNNADFVKAITGQDLPTLTNTAKRTIVFNFPNGTHETVNQIINYKALAPVQIDWPIQKSSGGGWPSGSEIGGGGSSSGTGSSVIIGGHGSSSGGFDYELGGGGFSSGTGSSVVVGSHGSSGGGASGSGSSSGGGSNVIINEKMRMAFASFARVGASVQTNSDGPKIIKTYSAKDVKESDWQLDTSKPNDDVIIDGVIYFKPVEIPRIDGYKARLMKDPVNPTSFLVSFMALPKQLQNTQSISNNVQSSQKSVQPEQKQSEQKQPDEQTENTNPKPNALKQNLIAEKPESEIVVKTRNDIDPNKQSWLRWQFTDADDNNKAIEGAIIITGNSGDTFTKDQITLPKGYEDRSNLIGQDAANLKLPAARTIMTYTIQLFHHHTDLTKQAPEDEVKQTRSITVHYKYLDGGKANQEAAPDAKLDIYYSRSKSKDDVTGEISYTPWHWDISQGDPEHPGYHIVSGKWDNLPEQWGNVIANVPTIAGYTVVLNEPNRPDNTNYVNANEFVHPTWNNSFGSGMTNINADSLAYLTTNALYEAKNEHTVYYKANKQQNTIKFVDDDNEGAEVGKEQTIVGVTDQTVDLNLQIPKNYELAEGTKLPTSFKFAQSNTQTPIEIHLRHKRTAVTDSSQLHTTGKRTITIYLPHHDQPMIIIQTVGWQRTGDLDEVTNTLTYTDWKVDAGTSDVTVDGQHSTQYQAYVLKDGVVNYASIELPHINGYKAKLIKDPVNPAMFLVSFVALPQQLQHNQSNNVQLPQKPVQPEQKQPEQKQPEQKQPEQKQPEQKQPEQKQPERKQPEQKPVQSIQTRPADDKHVDQAINHISYTLMHNDSTSDNADNFESAQNDSVPREDASDSIQKGDVAKIANTAKPKKHIAKKHVVTRHKKHAKKYHLKRRARKHTKRSRHAKKRIIKHRKSVSRKFRKYNLKHIKKS